ncbi:alanine racemase [bacterium]|nr:alanine racemase [bacterium]
MSQILRPSYVEIDLNSLSKNYQIFAKSSLGQKFFCPMVKANAYGHGDVQIVQHLEKEGCQLFGLGLVEEGIRLREKAKSRSEILIFGFTGQEAVKELLHHCLTPVVSDFSQLELLEKNAQAPIAIHLKINTGMNRLGFQVEEIEKLLSQLQLCKKLKVIGLCTHLMSAEDLMEKQGHSQEQIRLFQKVVGQFASFPISHFHAYNSSGAVKIFEMSDYSQQNAYGLRIGLGLYGLLTCESKFSQKLYPVMSLKSKIVAVQKIKKGQSVSYGATWTADRDGWVGIVPLGYADGVPTQLSNKGIVQLGEKTLSIVGRVCMDYVMLDVTGVNDPVGKDVEFFGPSQTAVAVAQKASTIGYDILTRISERVPRRFVN